MNGCGSGESRQSGAEGARRELVRVNLSGKRTELGKGKGRLCLCALVPLFLEPNHDCMIWFFICREEKKGMLLHGAIYTIGGPSQQLCLE